MSTFWQHFTAGGVLMTVLSLFVKLGWAAIQKDRKLLADIHSELTTQRTNCLTTLQTQGARQLDVLEHINENLVEQNGYIKGYLDAR